MEVWKDIIEYEGYYKISNFGNIMSVKRVIKHSSGGIAVKKQKFLKPGKDPNGYLRCVLCKNGVCKTKKVHRLVASSFLGNETSEMEVNHIDGNKQNNHVSNLEWVTKRENMKHLSNVIGKKGTLKGRFSDKHPRSRITQQFKNGVLLNEFSSALDAHKATGVEHSNISLCCRGKRSTAGGYVWKYKIN